MEPYLDPNISGTETYRTIKMKTPIGKSVKAQYLQGHYNILYLKSLKSAVFPFLNGHCWHIMQQRLLKSTYFFFFFFVINNFYFLFFHTQHNRISKIKQNKTADTYSTSQGSIKREGEREGQQEHKSHSFK